MKHPTDLIAIGTQCKPSESKKNHKKDENPDFYISELDDMIPSCTPNNYDDELHTSSCTHKHFQHRATIDQDYIIDAPFVDESVLLDGPDSSNDDDSQQADSDQTNIVGLNVFPAILEIVKGSLLLGTTSKQCSVQQQEDRVQTLSKMSTLMSNSIWPSKLFAVTLCCHGYKNFT